MQFSTVPVCHLRQTKENSVAWVSERTVGMSSHPSLNHPNEGPIQRRIHIMKIHSFLPYFVISSIPTLSSAIWVPSSWGVKCDRRTRLPTLPVSRLSRKYWILDISQSHQSVACYRDNITNLFPYFLTVLHLNGKSNSASGKIALLHFNADYNSP
jgi:hypothetical protein